MPYKALLSCTTRLAAIASRTLVYAGDTEVTDIIERSWQKPHEPVPYGVPYGNIAQYLQRLSRLIIT